MVDHRLTSQKSIAIKSEDVCQITDLHCHVVAMSVDVCQSIDLHHHILLLVKSGDL